MKNVIASLTLVLLVFGATLSNSDGGEAPSITCPGDFFFFCSNPSAQITVHVSDPDSDFLTLNATAFPGSASPSSQTIAGTRGAGVDATIQFVDWSDLWFRGWQGPGVIYLTVTDGASSASCGIAYAVVTAEETVSIQCPADIIVQADPGQASAMVNYPAPTLNSSCYHDPSDVPFDTACDPPSGSAFPIGTTTVRCTMIYQGPGRVLTPDCQFNVTVTPFIDTQPPQISCAALQPSTFFSNPPRIVGHFQLQATDDCDSDPLIYVGGTKTAFVAGPFHNGDIVEVAHGPSLMPGSHPGASPNVAAIQLIGDVQIWAVDSSGNASARQICR